MTRTDQDSIALLRIGSVTAVKTSGIEITVDADKNEPSILYNGDIIDNVTIGKDLVIHRGYRKLVVRVEEEYLTEDRQWRDDEYHRDEDRYTRTLRAILQGELIDGTFERGRTIVPMIGNTAYIATKRQVGAVYSPGTPLPTTPAGGPSPGTLKIGTLNSDRSVPFILNISKFFASHIGIFGNTGSGKSYTLTQLYTKLFEQLHLDSMDEKIRKRTKFLFFDLNGEYSSKKTKRVFCDTASKVVYTLRPPTESTNPKGDNYRVPLPAEMLDDSDFWYTLLEATEKTQRPFIDRALRTRYKPKFLQQDFANITTNILKRKNANDLDTALVHGMIRDICKLADISDTTTKELVEAFLTQLDYHTKNGYFYFVQNPFPRFINSSSSIYPNDDLFNKVIQTLFDQLFTSTTEHSPSSLRGAHTRFLLRFYSDVAEGFNNTTFLRPLMARLRQRLSTLDRCFTFSEEEFRSSRSVVTIINLRYCSIEERKLIPLIVTRSAYKDHKMNIRSNSFLNIIIDEAHNLLSYESSQESETWRNTRLEMFEEVLKEGRKFGVFVTLASQRPHDISPTITSQLHHYFLHQLVNPRDIDAVRSAVSYLDAKSFAELSSLPRGTCIISGTSVQIPAIVKIDELDKGETPDNETINLVELWGLAPDSSEDARDTASDSAETHGSDSTAEGS